MSKPLISIIVPVYGVEKYLSRCINSLISQTYENLEIILIDDGSPDNCPIICDEFVKADCRIHVIHKQNGGLSSARNIGLQYAHGDFVGYVDSDDWVLPDMYAHLMNLIEQAGADCAHIDILETGEYVVPKIKKERISVLDGKEILQYYMSYSTKTGIYSVCQCLFKKNIIDNLLFREGYINEDIDFKYRALSNATKFIVSDKKMYMYFQGGASTISTGGLKKKDFQLYDAAEELYNLTKNETYGTIAKLGKVKKSRTAYSLLAKIAYYGVADPSIKKKEIIKKLKKENRKNWRTLITAPIGIRRKIIVTSFAISYYFTELIIHCFSIKHRNNVDDNK